MSAKGCRSTIIMTILSIVAIFGLLFIGFTVAPIDQLSRDGHTEIGVAP